MEKEKAIVIFSGSQDPTTCYKIGDGCGECPACRLRNNGLAAYRGTHHV